jgi:hypothetical protein
MDAAKQARTSEMATGAHLGNGHGRTLADDGQNIFLRFTDSAVIIFAAAPFRLQ